MLDVPCLDDSHRYWMGNRQLDGCTSMLADAGFIDRRWFTDAACLRGCYVHTAIEWDLAGDLDEATLDPALRPYLDAARAFLHDSEARVVAVEPPLADPTFGIAGKPDLVGYFYGKPALPDWKSGGAERWHRYQGAIYKHLARVNQMFPEPLIESYAVYLHDTGKYTLGDKSDRQDAAIAQAVITIAQAKRSHS